MDKTLPENVALQKASQSAFTKAMKTIKGLVQKGEITVKEDQSAAEVTRKERTKNRGVVHLSHVPHGFYEEEMMKFFSQFGDVTRLKIARSKKTGKSRGFAFIEFEHREVAEIVAETMNNYLMFTKLVKADYIPPEKFSEAIFFGPKFRPHNCPGVANRVKNRKLSNRQLTDKQFGKRLKRSQAKLRKMQAKLDTSGIDYKIQLGGEAKFAAPVVSTEALKDDDNSGDVVEVVRNKGKKRKSSVKQPAEKKPRKSGKSTTPKKAKTPPRSGKSGNSTPSKTPLRSGKKTPSKVHIPSTSGKATTPLQTPRKTPSGSGKATTPSKVQTSSRSGKANTPLQTPSKTPSGSGKATTPSKVQTSSRSGKANTPLQTPSKTPSGSGKATTSNKVQTPGKSPAAVPQLSIGSAKKQGRKSLNVSTPAKKQIPPVINARKSPQTKKLATPKNVPAKITPKLKSKLQTPTSTKRSSMSTELSPTKKAKAM